MAGGEIVCSCLAVARTPLYRKAVRNTHCVPSLGFVWYSRFLRRRSGRGSRMSANSLLGYGSSQADQFELHRKSFWEYESFTRVEYAKETRFATQEG